MAAHDSKTPRRLPIRVLALVAVIALIPAGPASSQEVPAAAPEVDATLRFVTGGVVEQGTEDSFPGWGYFYAPGVLEVGFTGLGDASRVLDRGSWSVHPEFPPGRPGGPIASGELEFSDIALTMRYPRVINDYDGA